MMAERTRREEIKKQLIDQPLHIAMGVASIAIIGAFFFYWPFSTSNYAGLIIFLLLMVIAYLSLIHK